LLRAPSPLAASELGRYLSRSFYKQVLLMEQQCLLKSLEYIRGFFNLYLITLATFGLKELINFLNRRYYDQKDNSEIDLLNRKIKKDYFSLIYGILFFAFFLIISFMFVQLEDLVRQTQSCYKNILLYFPWIASPFHHNILSLILFISLIILGILYALGLGLSHLFREPPSNPKVKRLFKNIGYANLMVFFISSVLMIKLIAIIIYIRGI
jgi:hypothetical protein